MTRPLQYPKYVYWLVPVIIYIVLFEFILPLNKILPGLTLIVESFSPLFKIYNFLFNLFYTASGIYVSMLTAYYLIYFTGGGTISFLYKFYNAIQTLSALKYFPLAGILVIFIFWFPTSNIAEYIFSISFSLLFLYRIIFSNIRTVKHEYIDSGRSLGMSSSEIYSMVYWKSIQPALFKGLRELHISLWTIMVIFELIKGDLGIGSIYKLALEYNDVSVMFTLSVILMLVLITGNFVLKFLKNKLIYWEN